MKKILLFTAMLSLVFGLTAFAKNKVEKKPQTKCPICKMDINKNLYADYKGKRVYFGCESCPEQFMKNPEKYIKQMEEEGIVLEKSPVNSTDKQGKSDKKMMMGNMHKKMMMNDKKDKCKAGMMMKNDNSKMQGNMMNNNDKNNKMDEMMKNCCKKDNNSKCTHMKDMKKMKKTSENTATAESTKK